MGVWGLGGQDGGLGFSRTGMGDWGLVGQDGGLGFHLSGAVVVGKAVAKRGELGVLLESGSVPGAINV
jgi:hypothetical protein